MSLYNIKTDTAAQSYNVEQFIITKFDHDLNPEASYLISSSGCSCPAGVRPMCRHRQMLPNLRQRANTVWFWDFTREAWVDPTGEAKLEADQVSIASYTNLPDDTDVAEEFSKLLQANKPATADEPKLEVGLVPGTGLSEVELAPKAGSQASFRRRI